VLSCRYSPKNSKRQGYVSTPLRISEYLAARRELVIEEVRRMVPAHREDTGGLYELMLDYPLRPGKAIRPALSIAVCRGAGGS
jgi:geranylgeranyl diphosphate synthase type II